ncbi:MAG: hypothetical protein J2P58_13635, partial [Acidimicrobiaceae bacterium]|nr:hypothetical protein [Acidimicrobiaceae bacterium]
DLDRVEVALTKLPQSVVGSFESRRMDGAGQHCGLTHCPRAPPVGPSDERIGAEATAASPENSETGRLPGAFAEASAALEQVITGGRALSAQPGLHYADQGVEHLGSIRQSSLGRYAWLRSRRSHREMGGPFAFVSQIDS